MKRREGQVTRVIPIFRRVETERIQRKYLRQRTYNLDVVKKKTIVKIEFRRKLVLQKPMNPQKTSSTTPSLLLGPPFHDVCM